MERLNLGAIIFDMDGVITNTMPTHFRIWRQIFAEQGIRVSREDIYAREGQRGIESLREIFSAYGRPFTVEQGRELLSEKEARFKKIVKCRFITGARQFLYRRSREGFQLGLVTGTSRHEMEQLLPKSMRDLFHVTVCGCEVKNGKPHPEPYVTALNRLDLPASQAVVIENAPFGVMSAKAAGIRCLGIATSLPKSYLHQADAVFDSFTDLSAGVSFCKRDV